VGNRHEPLYSMAVVRRRTGLTERQLRYWEQQGLVSPARTAGRHRLYSEADVEELLWVAALRRRGYRLAEVMELRDQRPGARGLEGDARFYFQASALTRGSRGRDSYPVGSVDRPQLLEEIERRRASRLEKGWEQENERP